jgi:hypothetical protein
MDNLINIAIGSALLLIIVITLWLVLTFAATAKLIGAVIILALIWLFIAWLIGDIVTNLWE